MKLNIEEFKDYIFDIAEDLINDENYRPFLRKAFKDLNSTKREEVITACKRILSVLDRKNKIIEDHHKETLRRRRIFEKNKDGYLDRQDAIDASGWSVATFDRKAKKFKEDINGRPKYPVEKVAGIARLLTNSSIEGVLCIDTFYHYVHAINAYVKFEHGDYYMVIRQTEQFIYVFNDNHDISCPIGISYVNRRFKRIDDFMNLSLVGQQQN